MPTAGPNIAGTGADDSAVGTLAWSNPTNITADDSSYATISNNITQSTHYLKATNFGFALPSNALVAGIQVEWERKTAFAAQMQDAAINLVKGGSVGGNNNSASAIWSTTESYVSFGGSSDLWGQTWTYNDINDSTFGAVLQGLCLGSTGTASVNACRITITYTTSTADIFQFVTILGDRDLFILDDNFVGV